MAELKSLNHKRGVILRKLKQSLVKVENFEFNDDLKQLIHSEKLLVNNLYSEFSDIQSEIDKFMNDDNEDILIAKSTEIEQLVSSINKLLHNLNSELNTMNNDNISTFSEYLSPNMTLGGETYNVSVAAPQLDEINMINSRTSHTLPHVHQSVMTPHSLCTNAQTTSVHTAQIQGSIASHRMATHPSIRLPYVSMPYDNGSGLQGIPPPPIQMHGLSSNYENNNINDPLNRTSMYYNNGGSFNNIVNIPISQMPYTSSQQGIPSNTFESSAQGNYIPFNPRTSIYNQPNVNNQSMFHSQLKPAKLPDITIPIFNGKYSEWNRFRDIFSALVHNNVTLDNIIKFQYLMTSLREEPLNLINNIQFSSYGYAVAWKTLMQRYDNARIIIDTHISNLFNIKQMTCESAAQLRSLIDICITNKNALECLNYPFVGASELMLMHLVLSKLDSQTRRIWELQNNAFEIPSLNRMIQFLTQHNRSLEMLESTEIINDKDNKVTRPNTRKTFATTSSAKFYCEFCKDTDHSIYKCNGYLECQLLERQNAVKELKLCYNCLKRGHQMKDCQSMNCKLCKEKHHTSLHIHIDESNTPPTQNFHNNSNSEVILSTAVVRISDRFGKFHKCRALLDSCSQSHFITERLLKRLHLKCHKEMIPLQCVNNTKSNISKSATTTIQATGRQSFKQNLSFLVVDTVAQKIPSQQFSIAEWNIPSNKKLADERFNIPGEIDILLSAEIFLKILRPGTCSVTKNDSVVMHNTVFGWILGGKVITENQTHSSFSFHSSVQTLIQSNIELKNKMEKFWMIEKCQPLKLHTKEEIQCEEHFVNNTIRTDTGRYQVKLPLKLNHTLGASHDIAHRRLMSIERKLKSNDSLTLQYQEFMNEYIQLNHMTEIAVSKIQNTQHFVLPHHYVLKPSSTTTKLRVVFDASSRSNNGNSLNDILMTGPVIQDELFSIMVRFRKHKYVYTTDIEKMYRQILVAPEDRILQCILWRHPSHQEAKLYQLNTVTYGVTTSPFLATRVLKQLALDESSKYPLATKVLSNDAYVDDIISGSNDLTDALKTQHELIELLKAGGMKLRKWCSNSTKLLETLEQADTHTTDLSNSSNDIIRTLGLEWKPVVDKLTYCSPIIHNTLDVTKRNILSAIAGLFDPLGLIGPIIVNAKLIMRELWKSSIDWDEPIPSHLRVSWLTFQQELNYISEIEVERNVMLAWEPSSIIQLHAFSDASEQAYGTCVYIRVYSANKQSVLLCCSKSRIAPLKTISLPRLELCAFHLMSTLVQKIITSMDINFNAVVLWTDSEIVLNWLRKPPYLLETFVANRVADIQQCSPDYEFRHISTQLNPADIISRGSLPRTLSMEKLWWHGPPFLKGAESLWPKNKFITNLENLPDIKPSKCFLNVKAGIKFDVIYKISSFKKLVRIFAYVRRFINNSQKYKTKLIHQLSIDEQNTALHHLIYVIQRECFADAINKINTKRFNEVPHNLLSLNPFIDDNGYMRVGGRLQGSAVPFDVKHPILLPSHHPVTKLYIRSIHQDHLHAPQQALTVIIRQRYWIINIRSIVRQVIHKCIICFKSRPQLSSQLMGNLPEPSLLKLKENSLNRWQNIQQRIQAFWQRWHTEYLTQLQVRSKWTTRSSNLKVGTLVLLKDDNLPPMMWRIGRIISLHSGTDNLVRVVDIKTSTGTFTRAVTKVAVLPIDDPEHSLKDTTFQGREDV